MPKHKKKEPPYVYLYIYAKLVESYNSNYVKTSNIKKCMRSVIRVPVYMLDPIMFQMEEIGLIERINKQKYKVNSKRNQIKKLIKLRTSEYW